MAQIDRNMVKIEVYFFMLLMLNWMVSIAEGSSYSSCFIVMEIYLNVFHQFPTSCNIGIILVFSHQYYQLL